MRLWAKEWRVLNSVGVGEWNNTQKAIVRTLQSEDDVGRLLAGVGDLALGDSNPC